MVGASSPVAEPGVIGAGIAVVTVVLPVLLAAAPAAAAAETPALSIELSDGLDEARPGDRLEYVATVRNEGAGPAAVRVSVTAPPSLLLDETVGGVEGATVSWDVELAAGERREFTVEGRVGDAIDGEYQIVTMATVARSDAPEVALVRTVDADTIPGVEGPPSVPGLEGAVAATAWIPWAAGAAAAVLAIAATGFGLWGLRLRRRTPA